MWWRPCEYRTYMEWYVKKLRKLQKLWDRDGTPNKNQIYQHLDFRLLISRIVRNKSPIFLVLCDSNPRKFTHVTDASLPGHRPEQRWGWVQKGKQNFVTQFYFQPNYCLCQEHKFTADCLSLKTELSSLHCETFPESPCTKLSTPAYDCTLWTPLVLLLSDCSIIFFLYSFLNKWWVPEGTIFLISQNTIW